MRNVLCGFLGHINVALAKSNIAAITCTRSSVKDQNALTAVTTEKSSNELRIHRNAQFVMILCPLEVSDVLFVVLRVVGTA